MVDAIAALGALTNAMNIARALRGVERDFDLATMKMQIADLMTSLADVRMQHAEMVTRIDELEKENERLLAAGGEIDALVEYEGYRFMPDDGGGPSGWPACPACIVRDKAVSIMVQKGHRDGSECHRCSKELDPVPSFVSPGLTRAQARADRRESVRRQNDASIRDSSGGRWMGY